MNLTVVKIKDKAIPTKMSGLGIFFPYLAIWAQRAQMARLFSYVFCAAYHGCRMTNCDVINIRNIITSEGALLDTGN